LAKTHILPLIVEPLNAANAAAVALKVEVERRYSSFHFDSTIYFLSAWDFAGQQISQGGPN
jgi:hypothetical protein